MTTMIDYSVNELKVPEEVETATQKSQYIRNHTKTKFASHELILHEYINIYRIYKCDPELLTNLYKCGSSQFSSEVINEIAGSTRVRNALVKHGKKVLQAVKVKKHNTKGWSNEQFYTEAKRITEELNLN